MLNKHDFYDEVLKLTKELISIPSINGTEGERNIAEYINNWLKELPYFKEHPEHLITQDLKNDQLNRMNVIGIVQGQKSANKDTVILLSHCDTVGIDNFGSLKDYAFDYTTLPEKIKTITDDPEILDDIESGDWLFGRGSCDMKSGVAIMMCITKYFSERLDQLDGNIVYVLCPVEENQHYGIIDALDILIKWKEKFKLNYLMSINTDFFTPEYPGDTKKYFHAGAVGKILPCYYIIGKPTHSGHAFKGFSSTLAAAEIVRQMELQTSFADEYNGEMTQPPVTLKAKDLKASYDVTSIDSNFIYFNYFIQNESMHEITRKLYKVAENAMNFVNQHTDRQYKKHCDLTGYPYEPISYPIEILGYNELYTRSKSKNQNIDQIISDIIQTEIKKDTDRREISLMIVKKLAEICNIKTPTAIIFISSPFCPRNTLRHEIPEEKALLDDIKSFLDDLNEELNEKIKMLQFFPVLSDSSYLKIDDDDESIAHLVNNFPGFGEIYDVPFDKIKALNIPSLSFGCYGKDGHEWTERVNLPYTLGKLPNIIVSTLEKYLRTSK